MLLNMNGYCPISIPDEKFHPQHFFFVCIISFWPLQPKTYIFFLKSSCCFPHCKKKKNKKINKSFKSKEK